jgi:capsular polysaccharide biosynthesis protein
MGLARAATLWRRSAANIDFCLLSSTDFMGPSPPFSTFALDDAPRATSLGALVAGASVLDRVFVLYRPTRYENLTAQFRDLWHLPEGTPGGDGYAPGPLTSERVFVRTMAQALVHPKTGLVFDSTGRVAQETTFAPAFKDPSLAHIAAVVEEGAALARAMATDQGQLETAGPLLYANHGGYTVFGHLMCETVPVALVFSPLLRSGKLKLLMPPAKSTSIADRVLDLVGLPAQVQTRFDAPFVWVNGLIVSSTCSGRVTFAPGPMHHDLAKAIKATTIIAPGPRRRVFLSRAGSATTQRRDLANEDALIAGLAPLGFETVNPSLLPGRGAIALFAQAECLISMVGSVWTDLLYAPRDALVIDLLPAHKVAVLDRFGLNMAKSTALPYLAVLCESTGVSSGNIDVRVDVPLVVDRVAHGLARVKELGL